MNDIHANMSPIELPLFTLLDWGLLVILLLLVAISIWVTFLGKQKKEPSEELLLSKPLDLPKRNTWPKDLKRLEKLIKMEQWKEFSHLSTHLSKLFFSEKKQINMLEKTSEEVLYLMRSHGNFEKIQIFFSAVDPVKFAGKWGEKERAERALLALKFFFSESSSF